MEHDLIIRGSTIIDGTGTTPFKADLAIDGDTITGIVPSFSARGRTAIDATNLVVAPGFINMLSWANESLIIDGCSQSNIRQGVTLEVLGEGWSMGPWNDAQKQEEQEQQGDLKYEINWTTLGEYLDYLTQRGISPNVASFVGATTIRMHELGHANRRPTADELNRMRELVNQAMQAGALGLSSALIYSPAIHADTTELTALAQVAADYGGMYISHIRNEGDNLLEAFQEFMTVARETRIRAEIYHIKATGRANWPKLEQLISEIETVRAAGLPITANMYTYNASSTGLNTIMPPWIQEGGTQAWLERLRNPEVRRRVKLEMNTPTTEWDNSYLAAGSPENILLVGFKHEQLKPLAGMTLAEIAAQRKTSPEEAAMKLVVEDGGDVAAAFFCMSEQNIRRKIQVPWISFGSDAQSVATEGAFLKRSPHPRTYGTFARLLGKYVREEQLITLPEAIRRLTSLPAANLQIKRRGRLAPGYYADVAVFDTATIADRATFKHPHQYATGMRHVLVNGVVVLKDGEHTGEKPGRVVRGPGWRGSET